MPFGAAAGRGRRSHKSHAADRGGIDSSRRGQGGAAPWRAAAQNTVRSRTFGDHVVLFAHDLFRKPVTTFRDHGVAHRFGAAALPDAMLPDALLPDALRAAFKSATK